MFHLCWATIQYSVTSSSTGLVTLYKSSRLIIFLGGLRGLPLLELPLEEEDKGEVEFIGDCGGVTSY
jgi:hypothetical protein